MAARPHMSTIAANIIIPNVNTSNNEFPQDPEVQSYVSIKPDPMDTAKVKYTCNACQFSPKQLASLVEHINGVHLKRKNIGCSICSFKTSRKKSLSTHLNEVHFKEKRYPCQLCDFKGARKASLDKHLQVKHGPAYQCKHCNYSSKKEADFKSHILMVHGIQEVVEHVNTNHHTNTSDPSKPLNSEQLIVFDDKLEHGYCCSICKYSPSSMRYLRDHIRKVHLSKFIKCPHCDLKTKRKADLIKHIKRLHPETVEQQQHHQIHIVPPQQQQHQQHHHLQHHSSKPSILSSIPQNQLQHQQQHHHHQNDALHTAVLKSEIPITLHLQYPLQPVMPQIPVSIMHQQPTTMQITLPTIDTTALLNSYPAPPPPAPALSISAVPSHSHHSTSAQQHNSAPQYKKGMQQDFDCNTKCDDLIIYSDSYAFGLGCTVCNYAPNSLRYLRDHIRKVHLAKTYKCTYCELKTKRRADLVRHIKRIHEDPKRNAGAAQQQQMKMEIGEFMPH